MENNSVRTSNGFIKLLLVLDTAFEGPMKNAVPFSRHGVGK